jgi:hypothetical protein
VSVLLALREGVRAVHRLRVLGLLYYLLAVAPALLLVWIASVWLDQLSESVLAARVLGGEWWPVWRDLIGAEGSPVPALLAGLLPLLLATALAHVLLAGGVVGRLLDNPGRGGSTFLEGVARHAWPFLRATACFLAALVATGAFVGAVGWGFRRLADSTGDARWDLVALGAVLLLAFLLLAPLLLGHDLARLAAARHRQAGMLRGELRAWLAVLRRPRLFLPLALALLAFPLALHLGYYLLRRPFTPAGWGALLLLALAQQLVMIARGMLKVLSWGALQACYRELGEPELCRPGGLARPAVAARPGAEEGAWA